MLTRQKVYVDVNITYRADGTAIPKTLTLPNGVMYQIDGLLNKRYAKSQTVKGEGIRYTILIKGKQKYLYDEGKGKWFVEAKKPVQEWWEEYY